MNLFLSGIQPEIVQNYAWNFVRPMSQHGHKILKNEKNAEVSQKNSWNEHKSTYLNNISIKDTMTV